MGMTIAEKVMARAAGVAAVHPGQYVDCKLDRVIAHEEFYRIHTAAVSAGLKDGLPDIWDRERFHVVLDHFQPVINESQALRQRKTTPSEISACAMRGGVWNALRPYLEAFTADG